MRAHLAAIGCNGQEISRAHLAAIGCNGLMFCNSCFCTFFPQLQLDLSLRRRLLSSVTITLELEAASTVYSSCSKYVVYQLQSDEGLTTLRTRFRALCESDFSPGFRSNDN